MKPLPPQHPPPEPELEWLPAMTFTAVNARSTFCEPHSGQVRPSPAEYADMDSRTSKVVPHSWHTKS